MSRQFGRKLRSPRVNGHLVHLVHVGVFLQSVCELLSRQAAGSLKVLGRFLQCNRSHPVCKLPLERKARCQQGMTYARFAGSFILKFFITAFALRCVQWPLGEHISDKLMQPTTDISISGALVRDRAQMHL